MSIAKTEAARRAHHFLVFNDPEFHEDLRLGPNRDEVLRRYGLSREDLEMDTEGYELLKDDFLPFRGGWFKLDEASDKFIVFLNADVKKHEVQELWQNIQRFRKTNSKNEQSKLKSPDDPELLYAIFKARVRGHTFPQIFDMYCLGTLPSYENKPKNNFPSEFDIRKYYSKYYNPI